MLRAAFILVLAATTTIAAQEPSSLEPSIFLPESGWNRENRVLQYNAFIANRASAIELTAEWTLDTPAHQLVCTLPVFTDTRSGFGDATIHYRRQIRRGEDSAVAARVALVLPTRSARFGDAVTGLELGLPASVNLSERASLHGSVGARWLTGGTGEVMAQGAMAFALTSRTALVVDSSWTGSHDTRELVVRPGLQFSFELGALRLSPAVTVPIGDSGPHRAVLLLGIEHDL